MADSYGIKVSKAGEDVLTTQDKDLIFKPDFTLLKVKMQGTAGSLPATIAHGLAYVPQFIVFIKDPSSNKVYGTNGTTGASDIGFSWADTINLYVESLGVGSTAYYYIFYEQA